MPIGGLGGPQPSTSASMQAAGAASRAESAARRGEQSSRHVEDRLERLTLVCMAMWSLLQDKTNLTEADLLERVKLIDNIDGTPDGKATRGVRSCPKCHRTMSPRHRKCLYCGTEETHSSAFDAV
ncbi:MAG: hypothetical protein AAF586_03175 [Planctomycetota bacterium]